MRPATRSELLTIEAGLGAGFFSGVRRDVPKGERHWFVARRYATGFACLTIEESRIVGVLCRCWVAPEFRNNGIGEELYRAREALAKEKHLTRIQTVVGYSQQREAYQKRGFRIEASLPRNRTLMVLDLLE